MKKILHTLLVVFAACSITACSSSKSTSPGDAAISYMEYLKDGQYEKFVDGLYFESGVSDGELKDGKSMLLALLNEKGNEILAEKGGIKEVEVLNEEIDEENKFADVDLRITYGNGDVEEDDMKLIRDEKGEWKLYMDK